jgi:hypothetical protein
MLLIILLHKTKNNFGDREWNTRYGLSICNNLREPQNLHGPRNVL